MKNLKKLISVIIAVIMIVGSFATVSAADYADVESTNSYYKAIQVLSGLGIAKGDEAGNFNPTADVKRSEMVTFICRAMGEEDIANGAAGANFTDVAANHWAAGYIAWGVNRGIINGMGDGTFAPDAPVKYQDAVVMIMRALGYDRIAQRAENGGYPTGYLKVASQRGVLTGAGYDSTKAATREIIAQLINNALTAPIVEVSTYGLNPEDDRYIIHEANADGYGLKCLLSTTNKIYRVRATITDSFLVNPELIKEDGNVVAIAIDKGLDYPIDIIEDVMDGALIESIYAGESALNKAAVGEVVELYIVEDEDLNNWVALAAVGSKATVSTTVKYVADVEEDGDDYVLTYKENAADSIKKAKEIDVDGDATIYVNNKIREDLGAADLADYIDVAASWTLVRPKSETKAQGVFLTVYEYEVVKEVSAAKARIYYKNGGSLKLDPEVRENEKFFYNLYNAEGKAIALEDIKADDVLNILVPGAEAAVNEADSLTIYVTSNTVEGSVDEEGTDGTYVIAGEEYAVLDGVELTAGKAGKFYISIDGKVIDQDASLEINKNFAVISFAEETTKMGKSTFDIDLLTKDGAIETYTLASKVKIYDEDAEDGANYSATTTVKLADKFDAIVELLAENDATARLITFKTNANGDISEIRMPGYYGLALDTITNGKWDADFEEYDGLAAADAVLLIVPAEAWVEGDDGYTIDEDEVAVASFADMENEYEYTATIFQTEEEAEDYTFSFAIGVNKIDNAYEEAPLAVVAKVTTALVDGDRAQKVTFIQSGETKALTVEVGTEFDLASGDVFMYSVNAKGEIEEIALVVDLSEGLALAGDENAPAYNEAADEFGFVIGYLKAKNAGGFQIAATLEADEEDEEIAAFDDVTSIKFIENDLYTYAKVDLYGLANEDKGAIKAIDLSDIESSKELVEVPVVVIKLNEDGKAMDVVVFEDFENGMLEY